MIAGHHWAVGVCCHKQQFYILDICSHLYCTSFTYGFRPIKKNFVLYWDMMTCQLWKWVFIAVLNNQILENHVV